MKLFDVLLIVFALSVSLAHSTGFMDRFTIVKNDKQERNISSEEAQEIKEQIKYKSEESL